MAASDLTTTGFSIQPTTGPTGEITGYQVDNTLVVTLHDLVHAGAVIDAAARSVGDAVRLDGLTYSIGNTGDIDGQARANAVRTAEAHAQAMDVEQGQGEHQSVVPVPPPGQLKGPAGGHQVGVAQHRPLGGPGGPRGEHDERRVVGPGGVEHRPDQAGRGGRAVEPGQTGGADHDPGVDP